MNTKMTHASKIMDYMLNICQLWSLLGSIVSTIGGPIPPLDELKILHFDHEEHIHINSETCEEDNYGNN
jgi:hypothetical protein